MPLFRKSSQRRNKPRVKRSSSQVDSHRELGFDYTLKRSSRRRSVAVSIQAGEVSLSAPEHICEQELHSWLSGKREWVLTKLQQQQERAAEIPQRQYRSGETLYFLGNPHPLRVAAASRSGVTFTREGGFTVALGPSRSAKPQADRVQSLLHGWYKRRALELLSEKTQLLCADMGLQVKDVCVRRTKSKWGHCTSAGVIQYNWLVLAAPEPVIDYLVAHEVCHLRHHNHSRAFWSLVASVCCNYSEPKAWLQRHGHTLTV